MSIKALIIPFILSSFTLPLIAASGGAFRAGADRTYHSGYHGGYYHHYRRWASPFYGDHGYNDSCNSWRDGKLMCSDSIVIPGSTYDCNGWSCAKTYCSDQDCVWF